MRKNEFLDILNRRLRALPIDERLSAVEYYDEYISEAGVENEEDVIKKLQHPSTIAAKILAEYSIKEPKINESRFKDPRLFAIENKKKKNISIVAIIIAILLGPITLPLGLAAIAVIIALVIAGIAILSVPFIVGGALGFSGILILPIIGSAFRDSFWTGLTFFGFFLITVGIFILTIYLSVILIQKLINFFKRKLSKKVIKEYGDE